MIKHKFLIFALSIMVQITFFQSGSSQVTNDIATVRGMTLGAEVKIKGTVTVPSGAFSSSIPFGYAIQDVTGGIYIVDTLSEVMGEYKLGDVVEVTGILGEAYGLLNLKETKANVIGSDGTIQSLTVPTGKVGEETEGSVITTFGVIKKTKNDAPYGYKVFIDDGSGLLDIYMNTSADLLKDTFLWTVGTTISVTGFSSQYIKEYECDPRTASDIKILEK